MRILIKEDNKEEIRIIENFAVKELSLGHTIILRKEAVTIVLNSEVCPLRIVRQKTVDGSGKEEEKIRVVHDLFFSVKEKSSVN